MVGRSGLYRFLIMIGLGLGVNKIHNKLGDGLPNLSTLLGSDLKLWLPDCTKSSNIIKVGSKVSTWLDKSGNGQDAVESIDARRPVTNVDGLFFNGSNILTSTLLAPLGVHQLFILYKHISLNNFSRVVEFNGTNRYNVSQQADPNTNRVFSYMAGKSFIFSKVVGSFDVVSVIANNASSFIQGVSFDMGGITDTTDITIANSTSMTAGANVVVKEIAITNLLSTENNAIVMSRFNALKPAA